MGQTKQQSMEAQLGEVEQALRDQFAPKPETPIEYLYVVETHDDYVIVNADEQFYQVPFSMVRDMLEFAARAEWQEVTQETTWAAKLLERKGLTRKCVERLIAFGGEI